MTLGENIVRLRTQKNWSQGDLADALDISRQSVSKWETDASIPELDKLLKLSELFDVTLDELVRGEEVPKTETAMPAAQTVPASFAPQATPEREKRRTIAGTVSLCTGAVILVFCLLLAGDPLTGLLFASPFLICGIICFAVKQRVGLCCGWAVYLCIDLYLRFATGLSWTTIFMTHLWTAQMNYARLSIISGEIFLTGGGKPMSRCQIWAEMKRVCKAAGVDSSKVFPHNLRHLFATVYYRIYKDIVKLADILGHSSVETTRIYLLTTGQEHRQQLERLRLVL